MRTIKKKKILFICLAVAIVLIAIIPVNRFLYNNSYVRATWLEKDSEIEEIESMVDSRIGEIASILEEASIGYKIESGEDFYSVSVKRKDLAKYNMALATYDAHN